MYMRGLAHKTNARSQTCEVFGSKFRDIYHMGLGRLWSIW